MKGRTQRVRVQEGTSRLGDEKVRQVKKSEGKGKMRKSNEKAINVLSLGFKKIKIRGYELSLGIA